MISVLIIDAQRDTREGLSRAINRSEGMTCVAAFPNARQALVELEKYQPQVILMDLHLPDMRGPLCVQNIRRELPATNILVLADHFEDEALFESLRSGAYGFLEKGTFPSAIIKAIQDIHQGGAPMSQEVARRVVSYFSNSRVPAEGLSEREQSVFQLLCEGLSSQEIAKRLHVSANTIRFHLKNIYRKLGVNSRYEALSKVYHREMGT